MSSANLKVERGAFLLLVGAIASTGACGDADTSQTGDEANLTEQTACVDQSSYESADYETYFELCDQLAATECAPYQLSLCDVGPSIYKPEVAVGVTRCMLETSCWEVYECQRRELGRACADDTANEACDFVVDSCGEDTRAECLGLFNGLSEDARYDAAECVMDEQCEWGIWSCIEGINPGNYAAG